MPRKTEIHFCYVDVELRVTAEACVEARLEPRLRLQVTRDASLEARLEFVPARGEESVPSKCYDYDTVEAGAAAEADEVEASAAAEAAAQASAAAAAVEAEAEALAAAVHASLSTRQTSGRYPGTPLVDLSLLELQANRELSAWESEESEDRVAEEELAALWDEIHGRVDGARASSTTPSVPMAEFEVAVLERVAAEQEATAAAAEPASLASSLATSLASSKKNTAGAKAAMPSDYHSEALQAVKEYRVAMATRGRVAANASNAKAKASVTFRDVDKEARYGTPHYQPLKSVLVNQGGGPLGCVTDALAAVGKVVAGWCGGT